MSYDYCTMVKASSGFWENLIMKQINKEKLYEIERIGTDEIIIISRNSPVLEDIIKLSNEYPHEVFRIKISGEDVYENYVYLYECSNGNSKLVNEGYEYCFGIKASDSDKLDKNILRRFKNKVVDYFQKLELSHNNNIKLDISFDKDLDDKEEMDINMTLMIRYKTNDVCLIAMLVGRTYIDIEVEFLDKKEKQESPGNDCQSNYADLPF